MWQFPLGILCFQGARQPYGGFPGEEEHLLLNCSSLGPAHPTGQIIYWGRCGGGGALLRGSSLNSLLGAKCQESELNPRPSCLGAVWLPDCGRGSGRGNGRSLPSRLFQCVESSMPGTWYPSPLCWNMGQKSFRSSLLAYPMWF